MSHATSDVEAGNSHGPPLVPIDESQSPEGGREHLRLLRCGHCYSRNIDGVTPLMGGKSVAMIYRCGDCDQATSLIVFTGDGGRAYVIRSGAGPWKGSSDGRA